MRLSCVGLKWLRLLKDLQAEESSAESQKKVVRQNMWSLTCIMSSSRRRLHSHSSSSPCVAQSFKCFLVVSHPDRQQIPINFPFNYLACSLFGNLRRTSTKASTFHSRWVIYCPIISHEHVLIEP